MVARLLLPVFGGSPAVWNTCMVFFQTVLLAGYAYAHGSLGRLGVRRQQWLHLIVLLLSLWLRPRALHLTITGKASPVALILAALTLMAGVPFFVLSTNSSLTQRWISLSNLNRSGDPFWLYAASNVGSLVALLAYPFLIEPALGLAAQLRWWSIGYEVFVALSIAIMFVTRRTLVTDDARTSCDGPAIVWPRRLRWIV